MINVFKQSRVCRANESDHLNVRDVDINLRHKIMPCAFC